MNECVVQFTTAAGGTPDAIASSTTKPSVSESEGMTKTSAAAKARDKSSPFSRPVKTTSCEHGHARARDVGGAWSFAWAGSKSSVRMRRE